MSRFVRTVGRKGQPTYTYDGRFIYSVYDPVREASAFVTQNVKPNRRAAVTVCGADFVNQELLRLGYNTIISIDLSLIAGKQTDFEPAVTDSHIHRVRSTAEAESVLLQNEISASDLDILIWTPYIAACDNADTESLLHDIKNICQKITASKVTADIYGKLEHRNAMRNVMTLDNISYLPVQNVCNTAVIVASGASLPRYEMLLRTMQDKALIAALPSAVKYLLSIGIIPDFVIGVDPGYATLYHLYIDNFHNQVSRRSQLYRSDRNIRLICPLSVNPSILRLPHIEPIFFSYENDIDRIVFADTDAVRSCSEGSVIFNAVRVVRQLGCRRAVLLGQDFSFYEHRSHVRGGYFETEYIGKSNYYAGLEQQLLMLRGRKEPVQIQSGQRMLDSDVSLQIYMEHLLSHDFGIDILLPDNAYNTLNGKFGSISVEAASALPDVTKNVTTGMIDILRMRDNTYIRKKLNIKECL